MLEKRNKDNLTEKEFLKVYEPGDYDRPSVTVDMLLFTIDDIRTSVRKNIEKELKMLLIKRNDHPYIDAWALPGGFVDIDEDITDAAYRELKEETNLSENIYLEQLYTFGSPKRDPRMRVISVAYMALTSNENIKDTKAGDDAREALWFSIRTEKLEDNTTLIFLENKDNDISICYQVSNKDNKWVYKDLKGDNHSLAFDHIKSIHIAIRRLRGKVFYTNIAFSLLPEKFTLTEVQKVYEVILGEELDKSNFRKKILELVEEVKNEKETNVAYRPAKYFKLKEGCPLWQD